MSQETNYFQVKLVKQDGLFEAGFLDGLGNITNALRLFNSSHPDLNMVLHNATMSELSLICETGSEENTIKGRVGDLATALAMDLNVQISNYTINKMDPTDCLKLMKSIDRRFKNQEVLEFTDKLEKDTILAQFGAAQDGIAKSEIDEIEDTFADLFEGLGDEDVTPRENKKLLYVDALVGVTDFKQELASIAKFSVLNSKLKDQKKKKRVFPLHYIFSIGPGMGRTTMLKTLAANLKHFGLAENNNFIEYEGSVSFETSKDKTGIFTKNDDGSYGFDRDYSVIALNLSHLMGDPLFSANKLIDIMWDNRGKVVFVLILEIGMKSPSEKKLIERVMSSINCHFIEFPSYTDTELLLIGSRLLQNYGFDFDKNAAKYLLDKILEAKQEGRFENIRSIQKIIEVARVERLFRLDDNCEDGKTVGTLSEEDFTEAINSNETHVSSSWNELDALVGMESVKEKLKEIVAYAKVQQVMTELDLEIDNLCYHMMFTGNPGTGKTTLARILGKMFKEIGFLKKGDVIEVSRENLIGRYVGQTAPIVREKVNEALGSILFIDEAYSLYGGKTDKVDYGYEALSTLIKEMEDKRDQFIVIMAGYTEEMEELFEMNPGLQERVPYKIEFPDYNAEELTEIFIMCLGKNFILEEGVREKIVFLFETALANKNKKFGNGRLARNLAERLKIKHSMRLYKENAFSRDDILTINKDDIEALQNDKEVKNILEKVEGSSPTIGFHS